MAATRKPKITTQERDWHEHKAGVAASKKAGETDSEIALNVLEHSTTSPETACGWELRPATAGTTIELSKLAAWVRGLKELEDEGEARERELNFLTLTAMAYADALRFRNIRLEGGFDALIAEAERINYETDPAEQQKMFVHVGVQLATLDALTDSQKSIIKQDDQAPDAGK